MTMTMTTEQVELCWCPLCNSASPESQARLREIASYGMARFMQLALKAGVNVSPEQQADIFASILDWDPAGAPGECDWMVHEHAMRALCYGAIVTGDGRLEAAMATAPAWDANWNAPGTFNPDAEVRIGGVIADALESLKRKATA